MPAGLWIRYLLGQGSAIREVAQSRAALWTGMWLVLLTAIARNCDQTFIGEKPILWLFGPLLFSLVSGTWLYLVVYGWLVRRGAADADRRKPPFWSGWRSFMGLFWMTAPIAWLYAIPVERLLDPLPAARANLVLLGIVSLWRVLLMARVVQCLAGAPYFLALLWVLFAAVIETLVVIIISGTFAKSILAAMGGMRNSPEETLLLDTLTVVFRCALYAAPILLVMVLLIGTRVACDPFPQPLATPASWNSLAVATALWLAIALYPQIELYRNHQVEQLLSAGRAREALEYLSSRQPWQFAPSRTLPPKPFEYSVFDELPACFAVVQATDAPWVRSFLVQRLSETMVHYRPRWKNSEADSPEAVIEDLSDGIGSYYREPGELLKLLNGLDRIPEGRAWLATNATFLQACLRLANENSDRTASSSTADETALADWKALSARLRDRLSSGPNNSAAEPKAAPPKQ